MARIPIRSRAPKRSLGQNFLVDDNIARNIVRDLRLSPDDVVIEIGPGRGALSVHLAGRVRRLLLVEIDGRIVGDLRKRFGALPGVGVLHADFLELDLRTLREELGAPLRIVGNIPYHLTSPILFRVFDNARSIRDLTVMVQREVARRMAAAPGSKDYGILSVLCLFHSEPEILFHVSPNCFLPRPKVTSTVVRLAMRPDVPPDVDAPLFRTTVRTAFGKRRKTLRNGLKYLPFDPAAVARLIAGIDFPLDVRPEQLSVAEFMQLTRLIGRALGTPGAGLSGQNGVLHQFPAS